MRKKRVALLKGPFFNEWESQNFMALKADYEFNYVLSMKNFYDVREIGCGIRRFRTVSDYYFRLPALFRKYLMVGARRALAVDDLGFGLSAALSGQDIVHITGAWDIYAYQAAKLKDKLNFQLVGTFYENIPFVHYKNIGARKIQECVLRNIDKCHAVTQRAKEVLLLQGVPENKIFVQPFGIDTQRFSPGPKNSGLALKHDLRMNDCGIVLYVGQLIRQKGVYTLLYAWHNLLRHHAGENLPVLLMIGQGSELARLKALTKKLNISKTVIFTGPIHYSDLPDYYRLADIFVLPSIPRDIWQEQFGFVLVEALATGLPTISTLSGSIPEVVGDAGILVQPCDHVSLAEAINSLLDDEAVRMQFSKKARRRAVELFNSLDVSRRLKQLFE